MKQVGQGPLAGVRIVELGGIGPGPFCCMLLSDLGAEVVRIERPPGFDGGAPVDPRFQLLLRGRRTIALDLKKKESVAAVLKLVVGADALIEGFRPGVAEKLGLGPEPCAAVNPKLVYGRMTGWGQDGPLAQAPGHDVNYISLTGVVHSIGMAGGPPVMPLNLVGDFGGGSLYLALGVVSAILEAQKSGKGQVVDAAMVDGSASLMTMMYGLRAAEYWTDERGTNRLDSGAPYYNVYKTSDGLWLSVGCNETRFWHNMLDMLGLTEAEIGKQHDQLSVVDVGSAVDQAGPLGLAVQIDPEFSGKVLGCIALNPAQARQAGQQEPRFTVPVAGIVVVKAAQRQAEQQQEAIPDKGKVQR